MEKFDFVIIGAGAGGEAAAHMARSGGATVAIVDRELFGGSCPFWACMPSKALLHAAAVHACGGDYPWSRASAFRDWMINREGIDFPDDGGHVRSLENAGAKVIRGAARIVGPRRVAIESDGRHDTLQAQTIIVASGTNAMVPDIPGLDSITPWTNREATATRELPRSLAILGGGPTAVELAQVYARYGVPVTIVDRNERLNHRDHPRNSEALEAALGRDGVDIRKRVQVERIVSGGGHDGAHCLELSDRTSLDAHEVLLAVGRTAPTEGLGLETVGAEIRNGRPVVDDRLRVADGVFAVGDVAGPEMHTHLAHYQGEIAVRIALGEDVRPDHRAIPRATYTDPETAGVGLRLDEAEQQGYDAFEETVDLGTSAKGYVTESSGHVTIVVDRKEATLLGAFIAGPGASEAIHEAVLALKLRVPLAVLADTIHAFPTTARVLGTAFVQAARRLAG